MLLLTACHHYCPAGLVATPPAPSIGEPRLPAGPAQLKILTWNIWMMPWFTFQSPHNQKRARAIAEELLNLDLDILCLEKAFDGGARAVLSKALGARYPYRYGPTNSGFSLKVNSGVWVLSRIPLSGLHEIQFRDCAGVECAALRNFRRPRLPDSRYASRRRAGRPLHVRAPGDPQPPDGSDP